MKLFYTAVLVAIVSIAQAQTPGLFVLNYSDFGGNGVTPDGKGAIYNFNNGNFNNCNIPAQPLSSPYNHPSIYTFALDSINGYLQVGINTNNNNYSQVGLNVHFFQENCNWQPVVDMRDPQKCLMEIRVRSNVNLDHFRILVATRSDFYPFSPWWIISDGTGIVDQPLVAGQWTTVKQAPIFKGYINNTTPFGTDLDSSKVIGFGLAGYNNNGLGVTAQLEVDYVRVGSAVQSTAYTEYELGRGTEWNYGATFPKCPRFIDVLNNPNVGASYNASNELELSQTGGSAGDEFFVANAFSDQYCIPLPLDMTDPVHQVLDIDIYSDQDVPEFAIDLNGFDEDGQWDVGALPAYQSLTGGIVNHLQFAVPVTTVNGKNFDLKRITGYNIFIPAAGSSRTNSTLYNFRISNVEVGSSVVTANVNISNTSIGLYPNPSDGKVYLNGNREGYLEIVDLSGKKQFELDVTGNQELNLNLAHGIYIAYFTDHSGMRYSDKLLIK